MKCSTVQKDKNVATCTALTAYEPSTNSDPCLTLCDWGALALHSRPHLWHRHIALPARCGTPPLPHPLGPSAHNASRHNQQEDGSRKSRLPRVVHVYKIDGGQDDTKPLLCCRLCRRPSPRHTCRSIPFLFAKIVGHGTSRLLLAPLALQPWRPASCARP